MSIPLRALILEDSRSDALLLVRELKRADYEVEFVIVDTEQDMRSALEDASWDIILSDYSMPSFSATAGLKLVKDLSIDIPFIIVSGTMGEEAAVSAMRAGAKDYFPKGRITRLSVAIERELREAEEREQLRQAEQALKKNTELTHLIQEVTIAGNEATEINEALKFTIDRICKYTAWSLGHAYLRTRSDKVQLTSSHIWYIDEPEKYVEFREVSEQIQFDATVNDSLVYRVFSSGEPIYIFDIEKSEVNFIRSEVAQKAGIVSAYAFPIQAQHDVLAVMEFFARTSDKPDQDVLNTILHIVNQFGRVIERDRANREIRALYNASGYLFNADNVHDLAQQIVQGVVKEFEHVDCGLLLVDLPNSQIKRVARAGQYSINIQISLSLNGPGLVAQAIREARIIYSPDVQKEVHYVANVPSTRSEMIVPLKTRDGVIGVLDLQSIYTHHFNQSDQRLLEAFAERAAAALEILQLYEAINRHAAQLEIRVAERTEELQKAKERVEAILNNSSDAIILIDLDGMIQQTNPRFVEKFGYDHDELFGQNISLIMDLNDKGSISEILEDVTVNLNYRRSEVFAKRKDGNTFPADAAFASFARDHEIEIVCSLRDISAQKQLEDDLRLAFNKQKELTELKSRFISMVSHEYRTPLAVIQSSSSLMLQYNDRLTEEKKRNHLEKITRQVKRLTVLLDDVLELSRAETIGIEFSPEMMNISDLCRELLNDTRQVNPNHSILLNIIGEETSITADTKLIRQIVSNLISNAVKYSPDQGRIEIALKFEATGISLSVRDEGIGIPKEDLNQLFMFFHRAGNVGQIQGSGLGLAIVKQAVEAHSGEISVESTVGQGTIFTISLPY